MFVDQLAGLPNDEELEREICGRVRRPRAGAPAKPPLPARFRGTSWKG